MDDLEFDVVSRRLGANLTRRRGAAAALAALLGAAVRGGDGPGEAAGAPAGRRAPAGTESKRRKKPEPRRCSDTCKGCCAGEACKRGTSDKQCGKRGKACRACTGGKICSKGKCVGVCTPTTCGGCCAGASCQSGFASNACGIGGGACVDCTASGRSCLLGACVGPCTVCPSGCAYQGLAAAVQGTPAGGTVRVAAGAYLNQYVSINRNITIEACDPGSQVVIDAGSDSYAFDIGPNLQNVVLRNLTVTAQEGTGIYVSEGSVVSLEGLTVSNCLYGAVRNYGALRLADCTIRDNEGHWAGALRNRPGASMVIEGNTVIRDNEQTGVDTYDTYGGGGVNSYDATLIIRGNTLITANTAAMKGGGVLVAGGTFSLSGNARITGNTAACEGGVYATSNGGATSLPAVSGVTPTTCSGNTKADGACSCANYSLDEGATCPNS